MKFYDCQTAPSPRRARMFIAEKRLKIETVEIDMRNQEQLSDEFKAINPYCTVPVLVLDDGATLRTTAGIRAYLEITQPEPPLMGRNATERGVVADLIWRIEFDGLLAVGECLRNTSKGMKDRAITGPYNYAQIPELGERGRTRAGRFLEALDGMIGDKPFFAGDALTAADIDAFIFVEFTKWIKLSPPEDAANLARWHGAMAARPSAAL